MAITKARDPKGEVNALQGLPYSFLGGYLGDRLAVGDRRWYVWVPILGGTLGRFFLQYADPITRVLGVVVILLGLVFIGVFGSSAAS